MQKSNNLNKLQPQLFFIFFNFFMNFNKFYRNLFSRQQGSKLNKVLVLDNDNLLNLSVCQILLYNYYQDFLRYGYYYSMFKKSLSEKKSFKIFASYYITFLYANQFRQSQYFLYNFLIKNSLKMKKNKKKSFGDFSIIFRKKKILRVSKSTFVSLFFFFFSNLTESEKILYLEWFFTLLYYHLRVYEVLLNIKLILDMFPQINPYISPFGWLTAVTEEFICVFQFLTPPFIRPYIDLRATIFLALLEHLTPKVKNLMIMYQRIPIDY